MKVAILSESEADDAAIRILVNGILGLETETVGFPIKARGWDDVCSKLPTVLKHLHFGTEAEAFVVVVDSDDSPIHQTSHEQPGSIFNDCRLCCLREIIDRTLMRLQPVSGGTMIKAAAGIAIPAIEAWFLYGKDSCASEAAWLQGGFSAVGSDYRKELKRKLFGNNRVSQNLRSVRMKEEAIRLATDLSLLESYFPIGFGALVNAIRGW